MTALLTANTTTAASLSAKTIAEIDTYLEAYARTGRFSGNVMVNSAADKAIIRNYGLANREHGVANTPETKFRIGSITKQFTAVAILQLQERGLLDVQAPISTYLPDYAQSGEQRDRITIHHLLTHTAGIAEYLDPEIFTDITEWMRLPATLEQLISRFKDLPLVFEPGKAFKYSNSGYVLLSQILETVSGQPYADYMRINIFDPLGMKDTGYEVPQAVIPHLAQGYLFIGKDTHLQAEPIDMSIPQGAGGLYSTLADLATWHTWLYGSHTESKVLSQKDSINRLMTPVVAMDLDRDGEDAFYGYGLVHDVSFQRQLIHHNGGINGFRSALAYYPQETLTISVLTNFENIPPEQMVKDLAAIVFGESYSLPEQLEAIDLDPALYEKYVGSYQLHPALQVEIWVEGDQLMGQATGQDSFELYPSSETDFFAKVVDLTLTFTVTESETISGFTLRQLGQELFAPKIKVST